MNSDWAPGDHQPLAKVNWLWLLVRRWDATIHIHHRRLLLLLSPKARVHFTVLQWVEDWRFVHTRCRDAFRVNARSSFNVFDYCRAVRRRHREFLSLQPRATSMSTSSNHFAIWFLAMILRITNPCGFWFHAAVPWYYTRILISWSSQRENKLNVITLKLTQGVASHGVAVPHPVWTNLEST